MSHEVTEPAARARLDARDKAGVTCGPEGVAPEGNRGGSEDTVSVGP